ncbi:MAG: NAD(P)H-hydrate dehydratase, partial [Candidatus Bipolaricaulia bacterium]
TSSKKIKEIDSKAVKDWGIPSAVLMENAGRSAVDIIREEISSLPEEILVISGKGNNGGDGLVISRRLIDLGFQVETFILGNRDQLAEETDRNAKLLERITDRITYCSPGDESLRKEIHKNPPMIIDAIFGIGIEGELRGDYPGLIEEINRSRGRRIAIDLPSGLPADTGEPPGVAVEADLTVTMGFLKLGSMVPEAEEYVGTQRVASVGYPEKLVREEDGVWELVDDQLAIDLLPDRPTGGHKGDFGSLLVVGGSPGMTGAPLLASKSGLRSGTGLVYLAGPQSSNQIFESNLIEGLTVPIPDEKGSLGRGALDPLLEAAEGKEAVAVGPGLGRKEETRKMVPEFLGKLSKPVVLDADGVVAFSDRSDRTLKEVEDLVLTPHPGELAALLDLTPSEVDRKRYQLVPDLARELRVTVLLKGVPTVIGAPSGEVALVNCRNSGLAKGGSGDVLTGLIGGFLAQGLSTFSAAQLGAWVHCKAGESGVDLWGPDSLQPGDLITQIALVLTELRRKKEEINR